MFSLKIDDELELRQLQDEDAETEWRLWHANADEHLRWFPETKVNKTLEQTRAWIKTDLERYADNKGFALGIWFKGELAGAIDLHRINWSDRVGEIGYWLGAAYQGQGLMTRSCRALLDHAFNEMKLNRVQLQSEPENVKSRAVAERLGFTQEGILREAELLHGRYVDSVVYGILASEWSERAEQG